IKSKLIRIAIIFVLIIVGLAMIPTSDEIYDEANQGENDGSDLTAEDADDIIEQSMLKSVEGLEALNSKEYSLARIRALAAKKELEVIMDSDFSDEKDVIIAQQLSTLIYKTSMLLEEKDDVFAELETEDIESILPKLELLERGYRENAKDWQDFAAEIDDQDMAEMVTGISNIQNKFADMIDENVDRLKSDIPGYVPVAEREITPGVPDIEVKEELAGFFDEFDADNNGRLSIGESEEFYYWVENNINYRYDDEEESQPIVGTLVGDGIEGYDYRQRPEETLVDEAGDCEDMSTLEQAFYIHFGIPAYVVGVNAEEPDVLDHASSIARISGNAEEFQEILGDLVSYEFEQGDKDIYGNDIEPGTYMIVDNAYSGALGYISGGIEPGTFKIHCTIPLDKGYEDWNEVVENCDVPMD
ncbi:transglutaminase-like domain-containing protein, partial [Thermoproteota archaeon]